MADKRKTEILFIESGPTDSFAKIPYLLRKRGYKTSLVTLTQIPNSEFIKKSYDQMISFNSKFFKINLKNIPDILFYSLKKIRHLLGTVAKVNKLSPEIVIYRATPNWMCYLSMKKFRKSHLIYFPYDIRSFTDISKNKVPNFEIQAERYCFENSDGILHKGFENELERLNNGVLGKNIKINCPKLQFLPYCLNELMVPNSKGKKLSKKSGGIHIVYVGHVATDNDWLENIKKITEQKVHLHVYGKTANFSKSEDAFNFKNVYERLVKSGYFHIHEPVDQKKLAEEISQYDYGFFSFNNDKGFFTANSIGNKFASYLEAGLPIICLENYKLVESIIKKYGIGFSVSKEELGNFRDILNKKNKSDYANNVEEARTEFSMEKRIKDLEYFFEKVKVYKGSKIEKRH